MRFFDEKCCVIRYCVLSSRSWHDDNTITFNFDRTACISDFIIYVIAQNIDSAARERDYATRETDGERDGERERDIKIRYGVLSVSLDHATCPEREHKK